MDIGFDSIKEMKIKDIIQLKADKERLEKENKFLNIKYPKARKEFEKEGFDLDEFLKEI